MNLIAHFQNQYPVFPNPDQIKLLILDVDGTIAGESNNVTSVVKEAIALVHNRGIGVAIATGRMYQSALRFYDAISSRLPIIAYQGSWIQDPITGIRHRHLGIPQDKSREILDIIENHPLRNQFRIHCYIDDELYVKSITSETNFYALRSRIKANWVTNFTEILDREPTKILLMSEEKTVINQLQSDLQSQYSKSELYITKSGPIYLEIAHSDGHKGSGVRFLAQELLGLAPENVMAIGDNFNDVEMLDYAGVNIAMGNAPLEVQQHAKWIAPTVDEDGVAAAIQVFLA